MMVHYIYMYFYIYIYIVCGDWIARAVRYVNAVIVIYKTVRTAMMSWGVLDVVFVKRSTISGESSRKKKAKPPFGTNFPPTPYPRFSKPSSFQSCYCNCSSNTWPYSILFYGVCKHVSMFVLRPPSVNKRQPTRAQHNDQHSAPHTAGCLFDIACLGMTHQSNIERMLHA